MGRLAITGVRCERGSVDNDASTKRMGDDVAAPRNANVSYCWDESHAAFDGQSVKCNGMQWSIIWCSNVPTQNCSKHSVRGPITSRCFGSLIADDWLQ